MYTEEKKQKDIQRAQPHGQCTRCGGELYPGTLRWQLWGQVLCEECLVPWIMAELAPYSGHGGEVEV